MWFLNFRMVCYLEDVPNSLFFYPGVVLWWKWWKQWEDRQKHSCYTIKKIITHQRYEIKEIRSITVSTSWHFSASIFNFWHSYKNTRTPISTNNFSGFVDWPALITIPAPDFLDCYLNIHIGRIVLSMQRLALSPIPFIGMLEDNFKDYPNKSKWKIQVVDILLAFMIHLFIVFIVGCINFTTVATIF